MRRFLFLLALCCAGCSSPKLVGSQEVRIVSASELPPPGLESPPAAERRYVIGPFDKLAIDVLGMPDLAREIQVDAGGHITFPFAGDIQASGKTLAELAETIEANMRNGYVRDPQVAVNVVEALSQTVAVDGQVARPGVYPIRGRMTLMRAVASAGGATEFARPEYVVLFRTVGEQNMATLYSLAAIRQGLYQDPEVYPDDVVLVGESNAKRIFRDILSASGVLAGPLAVILQQ